MKKIYLLLFLFISITPLNFAQENMHESKGSVHVSAGTMHVYRVLNIGYESPTLFKLGTKHQFRLSLNGGIWQSRLYTKNIGPQLNANLSYLFGEKSHKMEFGVGITSHFDKGLKGQFLNYIGVLPKAYIGYRYEKPAGKLFYKVGLGWYEVLQVGLGLRL